MGKAFQKQTETIEDEGEKKSDALKDLKRKEQTKAITYKSDDDSTFISKEASDETFNKRTNEILEMSKESNYGKLIYNFEGPTPSINFGKFGGPIYFLAI